MIGGELGLHCVILLCVLVCWSTCGHAIMEVQPIRTALSATLQPIINHNGGGANKSDCILCQDGNEANCVRPWFIHMHMDKVRSQFLFNVSEVCIHHTMYAGLRIGLLLGSEIRLLVTGHYRKIT